MFHATELAGEGPEREFLVDEVVECMYDTLQAAFKWYFENDANKKVGIHLAVSKWVIVCLIQTPLKALKVEDGTQNSMVMGLGMAGNSKSPLC